MKKVIEVGGAKVKLVKNMAGQEDSFVFLDPPYYPIPKREGGNSSVNNLYNGDYSPVDFLKLKLHCDDYTRNGIPFIMTNSDCEFIRILFKDYPIIKVDEPRQLRAKKNGKSEKTAKCVIITNMEDKEEFMEKIKQMNEVLPTL